MWTLISQDPVLCLLLLFSLSLLLRSFWERVFHHLRSPRNHGCQDPQRCPQIDPIFGLDSLQASLEATKQNRYLERQLSLFQSLGTTYSSNFLGSYVINTAEPENIKFVLSLSFRAFDVGERRRTAFAPLFGRGIFQLDGQDWKSSRKLLGSLFKYGRGQELPAVEVATQELLMSIMKQNLEAVHVNLEPFFKAFSARTALQLLFGETVPNVDFKLLASLYEAQKSCELRWLFDWLSPLLPRKKFAKNTSYVQECISDYVQRVAQNSGDKDLDGQGRNNSLLQELLRVLPDETAAKDETLTLLVAAMDTVAALLTNLFFWLAKHPHVWQKLRSEAAFLNNATPTFHQLQQLKYSRHCIDEGSSLGMEA